MRVIGVCKMVVCEYSRMSIVKTAELLFVASTTLHPS